MTSPPFLMGEVEGEGGRAPAGGAPVGAEVFKAVHPAEFLRRFVESGVRPDGRALAGFRHTTVSAGAVSTADGSVSL